MSVVNTSRQYCHAQRSHQDRQDYYQNQEFPGYFDHCFAPFSCKRTVSYTCLWPSGQNQAWYHHHGGADKKHNNAEHDDAPGWFVVHRLFDQNNHQHDAYRNPDDKYTKHNFSPFSAGRAILCEC